MRKLLVAMGLMGSLVMAAPSHAAELGQISGPGATHMWGGFYGGVNAGYGWGSSEWPELDKNYNIDGWLAGATGGFNIDSGDWIFGFEMDYDWTGMSGSQTGYPYGRQAPYVRHAETDLETLGTARVRAGYDVGDATNPLLLYVTGGLAFANNTLTDNVTFNGHTFLISENVISKLDMKMIDGEDGLIALKHVFTASHPGEAFDMRIYRRLQKRCRRAAAKYLPLQMSIKMLIKPLDLNPRLQQMALPVLKRIARYMLA